MQLLWVNLVTDGLPGLALGVEPSASTPWSARPPPNERLARGTGIYIIWVGLLLGALCLATEYVGDHFGWNDDRTWQTMVFTVLSLAQMGNALAVRSDDQSLFTLGIGSNRALLLAVLLTTALQFAVIYTPFLQRIFDTTALTFWQMLASLALSAVLFVAVEIVKLIRRWPWAGCTPHELLHLPTR